MKTSATVNVSVDSKSSPRLLDIILNYRFGIGDGLTDEEFSRFLKEAKLPAERGFSFLCYCGGFVTFSVPQQRELDWYTPDGRIQMAKENIARDLAQKHELFLYEPPDLVIRWCHMSNPHHHLQFNNELGPVVVAHPQYAKVRLIEPTGPTRFAGGMMRTVSLGPDVLSELATLYGS